MAAKSAHLTGSNSECAEMRSLRGLPAYISVKTVHFLLPRESIAFSLLASVSK